MKINKTLKKMSIFFVLALIILLGISMILGSSNEPSIKLTSDIILREDSELGGRLFNDGRPTPFFNEGDGDIINPNEREYPDEVKTVYLFEGEQIIFDVQIYVGEDIQHKLGDVYVTMSWDISEGRGDWIANCKEIFNRDNEEGIMDFHCVSEVGNINDEWGIYILEVALSTYEPDGIYYKSIYLGNYYFNPIIKCFSDEDCGTNNPFGELFCDKGDIFESFLTYSCINPRTDRSYCVKDDSLRLIEECEYGCFEGECLEDINPPEALIKFNPNTEKLEIIGIDDFDEDININLEEKCKNSLCSTKSLIYTLTDDSKNSLVINIDYRETTNNIVARILSLKYNDELEKNLGYSYFNVYNINNSNILRHNLMKWGQFSVATIYNDNTKQTTLTLKEGGWWKSDRFRLNGNVLPEMMTEKGKLTYNY